MPEEGSAGKRAQDFLGEDVRGQRFPEHRGPLTAARCADRMRRVGGRQSKDSRARVIEMISEAGMNGWHAGPIANAAAAGH